MALAIEESAFPLQERKHSREKQIPRRAAPSRLLVMTIRESSSSSLASWSRVSTATADAGQARSTRCSRFGLTWLVIWNKLLCSR